MSGINDNMLVRVVMPNGMGELMKHTDGTWAAKVINPATKQLMPDAKLIPISGPGAQESVQNLAAMAAEANPVEIATLVAVIVAIIALANIEVKLTEIKNLQHEILDFLKNEKQVHLESRLKFLTELVDNLKLSWDNQDYKNTSMTTVQQIRGEAVENISWYTEQIDINYKKLDSIRKQKDVKNTLNEIHVNFQCYRCAICIYAFSYYLESVLSNNFSSRYLNDVKEKIQDEVFNYRKEYSARYGQLELYLKQLYNTIATETINHVVDAADAVIKKSPIRMDRIDDAIENTRGNINGPISRKINKVLKEFQENKSVDVSIFLNNLDQLDLVSNHQVQIDMDAAGLRITEPLSLVQEC